jgi:hypothetical protein
MHSDLTYIQSMVTVRIASACKPAPAVNIAYRAPLLMLVLVLLSAPLRAQDTVGVGIIRGAVVAPDGSPVAEAAVCAPETSQCVVTDAEGRFTLAVRSGSHRLEIVAPGRPLLASEPIVVRAGLDSLVEVTVPEAAGLQETVTVAAPAFAAPQEVKTSGFLIAPGEIVSSAGALQDVARYVRTLPGAVIGTDDFRNDLIVRGGSPLENLYIVDNIEIPNINTFANFASAGGTVGILDPLLIDNVTFLTGGYPAPYGNRTSSVLQIAQREGRRDRAAARATLGFAGAGGLVEGPVGRAGKASYIVSMRRSFLDLFTEDTGIGGVPVLYTINGKVVYDVSRRDRLWIAAISGIDRVRLGLTEDSDPTEELSNLDIRYRGSRVAAGVNWQRVFGTGAIGLFGVTHSRATVDQRVADLIRGGIPPAGTPVDEQVANGQLVFRDDSIESETTIKYDLTLEAPKIGKIQTGGSLKSVFARYDVASPLGTDNPFFADPDSNPFTLDERLTLSQAGVYLQATRPLGTTLSVTGGARIDRYGLNEEVRVSPRVGADVKLSPRVSLRASYGRYHQQPFLQFLAAYPQNRQLDSFRADHFVAGVAFTPDASTRVTLEAYRKNYSRYPVSSQIPSLSLANIGDTFNVRDVLFPMTSGGRGRALGIELFAERKAVAERRWSGEGNLSIARARHAGSDGVLRPGSFDYPVVANLTARYRWSQAWTGSIGMVYLAGRPFTPIDPRASTAQRRAVYDLGKVNASRAPGYFRLDVRVNREFIAGGRPLTIFGGVQNITNRKNVAGYTWDRRNDVIRTSEQLGIFPILGLEWEF